MKQETKKPEKNEYSIIRIVQTDIPGSKNLLAGLTYIKGVSWSISNAICKILELNPQRKISDLNEKEIEKITEFLKNPQLPEFLVNRRKDIENGGDTHLITTNLDMTKEFDVRRLKKIRSYRGLRHATGEPVRGQRTKSNFRTRKNKRSVGVKRKK